MYNTRTFISKEFKFEAAHSLPFHKGACFNKHGHSYHGKVTVSAKHLVNGMVMDYGDLKKLIQQTILIIADHKDLNTVFEDKDYYTTAENLCRFFFEMVENELKVTDKELRLECLSLKETGNSECVVYNECSSFCTNT